MNDREMLELAAKAAGFGDQNGKFCWTESTYPRGSESKGALWNYRGWGDDAELWNPLTDDGDALRLAAKLKIDLEWQNLDPFPEPAIEAYRREGDSYFIASEHEDNYRRAITRAAAEIARAADAGGKGI